MVLFLICVSPPVSDITTVKVYGVRKGGVEGEGEGEIGGGHAPHDRQGCLSGLLLVVFLDDIL